MDELRVPEPFREWLRGMNLYDRGYPADKCENQHQLRGWWSALWAEAEAEVDAARDREGRDD